MLGLEEELKHLFESLPCPKKQMGVVDFDDLLLYWIALLEHPEVGQKIRSLFPFCPGGRGIKDTNSLSVPRSYQRLCPDGTGLMVVESDFQAIYSFRGATVKISFNSRITIRIRPWWSLIGTIVVRSRFWMLPTP